MYVLNMAHAGQLDRFRSCAERIRLLRRWTTTLQRTQG